MRTVIQPQPEDDQSMHDVEFGSAGGYSPEQSDVDMQDATEGMDDILADFAEEDHEENAEECAEEEEYSTETDDDKELGIEDDDHFEVFESSAIAIETAPGGSIKCPVPPPQPIRPNVKASLELYQIVQQEGISRAAHERLMQFFNQYMASDDFGKYRWTYRRDERLLTFNIC